MQIDKIHIFIDLFDDCFGLLISRTLARRRQFIDAFDNCIEITDFSECKPPHTIAFGFGTGRDAPAEAAKCLIASRSGCAAPGERADTRLAPDRARSTRLSRCSMESSER